MTRVGGGQPLPPRSTVRRWRGGSVGLWGTLTGWAGGVVQRFRPGAASAPGASSRQGLAGVVSQPVQLTLPRGVVMAGGLGAAGLLAGTFWAGQMIAGRGGDGEAARGGAVSSTEAAGAVTADPQFAPTPDGPVVAMGAAAALDPAEVPGGAVAVELPRTDPRVPGLNYLMLVTVRAADIDEARRLQEFLRQQGVATILARSNNGRFVQVVDVSASFSSDDYRAGQYVPHLERMRRLGRAWKRHNNGLGSDLGSMTYYKFKG